MKKVDLNGRPFHFIGIGGIGMSALAYIVAKRRLPVSGSDLRTSHITDRLEALGAKIFGRQVASNLASFALPNTANARSLSTMAVSNVETATNSVATQVKNTVNNLPQVICSTAINSSNPEYQEAIKLGCPIFHRSDLLAALINEYSSIAVSGTHGKTTTSSAIAYVLLQAGLDPTIIIGGEVDAWSGNARAGESDYLVAEADESDGSLVKHFPAIGIITNIELDHPDRYQDLTEVIEIFQTFAEQCETLIGCIDDPNIQQHLKPDISYSLDPDSNADYLAKNVNYHDQGTQADIWERGEFLGTLNLQLLGTHNLSNALSVIAAGRKIGLGFAEIAEGLASFTGTKRRFELRGEVNQIRFIDDYAHHPKEIAVTLAAAKLRISQNLDTQRVVAVFQAHRYSRAQTFLEEFAAAFKDADLVVVTDIYSAGEMNTTGISGEQLASAIAEHHPQVFYHGDLATLPQYLRSQILQPGDLTMFLGAGNLNQTIPKTISLFGS
ncbi:UDP-N-acetylmuramate--L-alanine ligase [Xenococcus sp. PCC 7305]|nr:UDP-N-acetylmuramate--L-alanine ligase [Xenococcus sp. PCC 7305]